MRINLNRLLIVFKFHIYFMTIVYSMALGVQGYIWWITDNWFWGYHLAFYGLGMYLGTTACVGFYLGKFLMTRDNFSYDPLFSVNFHKLGKSLIIEAAAAPTEPAQIAAPAELLQTAAAPTAPPQAATPDLSKLEANLITTYQALKQERGNFTDTDLCTRLAQNGVVNKNGEPYTREYINQIKNKLIGEGHLKV